MDRLSLLCCLQLSLNKWWEFPCSFRFLSPFSRSFIPSGSGSPSLSSHSGAVVVWFEIRENDASATLIQVSTTDIILSNQRDYGHFLRSERSLTTHISIRAG